MCIVEVSPVAMHRLICALFAKAAGSDSCGMRATSYMAAGGHYRSFRMFAESFDGFLSSLMSYIIRSIYSCEEMNSMVSCITSGRIEC